MSQPMLEFVAVLGLLAGVFLMSSFYYIGIVKPRSLLGNSGPYVFGAITLTTGNMIHHDLTFLAVVVFFSILAVVHALIVKFR